ncbi:MAG: hypothetical protein N3A53_06805 [Verrucomicrobiae bacterium]|nr:hypothetical protein [Verrucomicrobiae bacterium]
MRPAGAREVAAQSQHNTGTFEIEREDGLAIFAFYMQGAAGS